MNQYYIIFNYYINFKYYRNDIVMLDGLLQRALNPTSMTAGYDLEENFTKLYEAFLKLDTIISKIQILKI